MKAAFIAIALATTCGTVYAQKTTARQRPDTEQRKPLTPEQRAEQRAKQVEKQAKRMAGQLAMDDATTEKFVATYKMYQDELYALRTEKNRPAVCPAPGKRPCAQAGTCPVKQN